MIRWLLLKVLPPVSNATPVNPAPLPVKVPAKVLLPVKTLFAFNHGMFPLNRASDKVPLVIFAPSRLGICTAARVPLTLPAATELAVAALNA